MTGKETGACNLPRYAAASSCPSPRLTAQEFLESCKFAKPPRNGPSTWRPAARVLFPPTSVRSCRSARGALAITATVPAGWRTGYQVADNVVGRVLSVVVVEDDRTALAQGMPDPIGQYPLGYQLSRPRRVSHPIPICRDDGYPIAGALPMSFSSSPISSRLCWYLRREERWQRLVACPCAATRQNMR
ncbi:hypothetical protein B0T18DRAFT_236884 [Schizothecium vesticola]|uniref:Uncharacterized protein n=1 Tax=Schizothecium vesticola TaxID=314040 RepID=A0AA40BPI2_9PEZI|nr:hypothetical protein B0T18DRAFT_236884 [Schizothecium vesticola]